MFTLKVENTRGAVIELTNNEENYQVTDISGLNPPNANINTSNYANGDGSSFSSSRIPNREVVITVYINGDIQKNRLTLYKFFRSKEWCKIYYKDEYRDVFVEGYVQTLDVTPFVQKQVAQISILCPDPYLKDIETIVQSISKVIKRFTFPFSINIDKPIPFSSFELEKVTNVINDSESKTGLIIDVKFMGTVNKLEIRNVDNGENFIIDYEFHRNDKLVINCNRGSKSIILTRDAIEYNLIPYVRSGSTFFQLGIGDNNFSFLADDGNDDILVDIHFNYYKVYLGV